METAIIIEALELAAKVGVPAVQAAIAAFNKESVTLDDIKALKALVQPAESYFPANSASATKEA